MPRKPTADTSPPRPATPSVWRNRIVGEGEPAPDQLLANPANWRIHPSNQQDALSGVLAEVGWVTRVIVNRATGFVVDGHARVALAISSNQPSVPVTYVDLTEAEEALILATLDPISAMAVTDAEKLSELMAEVVTDDSAIENMLNQLKARAGIFDEFDVESVWNGMPEFEQKDLEPYRQLSILFYDSQGLNQFIALIGKPVTDKTIAIWFPDRRELEPTAKYNHAD